jgi:solute carrier family 35 protein F1/2
MFESKDQVTVQASGVDRDTSTRSLSKDAQAGAQSSSSQADASERAVQPADLVDQKKGFFGYFKTKEFYITLALG